MKASAAPVLFLSIPLILATLGACQTEAPVSPQVQPPTVTPAADASPPPPPPSGTGGSSAQPDAGAPPPAADAGTSPPADARKPTVTDAGTKSMSSQDAKAPTTTPTPTPSADAGTPAPQGGSAGTIVPLYTSPGHPSWAAIAAAKRAHPTVRVVAVVNPANGPGGAQSSAYTSGIASLVDAGIQVIGYVATGYTARSEATVRADIDRWKSFYPQVTGIFFDEQSNRAGDEDYYRSLSQYSKSQGLGFTVGNPGTDTAATFVGALDTMLIYESKGLPAMSRLTGWHADYPASNFGVIPYGTSFDAAYVRMARTHVAYVYLNNDDLPNPWDSLPPYFDQLLAALE